MDEKDVAPAAELKEILSVKEMLHARDLSPLEVVPTAPASENMTQKVNVSASNKECSVSTSLVNALPIFDESVLVPGSQIHTLHPGAAAGELVGDTLLPSPPF